MPNHIAPAALLIAALVAGPAVARAANACPAGDLQLDAVIRAVEAAPTCATAFKVAEACAFGSTGDVQTTAIVIQKCESRMTTSQRIAYERAAKACHARHAGKDGSMYRAMAAFCAAEAAVKAAGKAGR